MANENSTGVSEIKKPGRPRGRPKKTENRLPTVPQEEQRSSVWLTTVANLGLLIAIFTIIFAAHRAIQQSKHATVVEPSVKQDILPTETPAAEVASETTPSTLQEETPVTAENEIENAPAENTGDVTKEGPAAQPLEVTAAPEEAAAQVVEDVKDNKVAAKKMNRARSNKRESIYDKDPYTNGGPLDLDRRVPTTAKIDSNTYNEIQQRPQINSRGSSPEYGSYTDHRNPWNSGGHMDLDSDTVRGNYNQRNYSSSTELVEKRP